MIRKIIFGYIIGFVFSLISIIIFFYFYTKKVTKIVDNIDKQEEMNSIVNAIPTDSEIKLIKVNDLQSVHIKFNGDKVVFLNFWATWCKPCIEELPTVIELYKKNKNTVDFFIISKESNDEIMEYLKAKNIDTQLPFYSLTDSISFINYTSIPRTYIIKNNIIYLSYLGKTNWNHYKITQFIEGLN